MKPNGEIVAYGGQSKDSNFDIIQGDLKYQVLIQIVSFMVQLQTRVSPEY